MTLALVLLGGLGGIGGIAAAVISWRVGSRPREDVAPHSDLPPLKERTARAGHGQNRSEKTAKNQPQAPQTRGRVR